MNPDRTAIIRLRLAIWHWLDDARLTTPAEIGVALGIPADDANMLLIGREWREGDVARLEAVAARLGVEVSGE